MTPGIAYALGAMLLFGLGDLVYKRGAAAGAQPHHFLMVQSWAFLPLTVAGDTSLPPVRVVVIDWTATPADPEPLQLNGHVPG